MSPQEQEQIEQAKTEVREALTEVRQEIASIGLDAFSIARIVHEANRAYCVAIGDFSQVPFEEAPAWQIESAVRGVEDVLNGVTMTPEQQHERWCEWKRQTGWMYGEKKSERDRTHPCLVPYDQLPREQRVKDHLFRAIVSTLTSPV